LADKCFKFSWRGPSGPGVSLDTWCRLLQDWRFKSRHSGPGDKTVRI